MMTNSLGSRETSALHPDLTPVTTLSNRMSILERRPAPAKHGLPEEFHNLAFPAAVTSTLAPRPTAMNKPGMTARPLLTSHLNRPPTDSTLGAHPASDALQAWWRFLDSFGIQP